MAWFSLQVASGLIAIAGSSVPPPTVVDVQAAYDREVVVAGALHEKDLKIVRVECHSGDPNRFFCEVGFVKTDIDSHWVYLDAALIEWTETGEWKLLRGLCRRLL